MNNQNSHPLECLPRSISPVVHITDIIYSMETACKLTIHQARSTAALVQV